MHDVFTIHMMMDSSLAGDYNMYLVLVDNGSSADILFYLAFQ